MFRKYTRLAMLAVITALATLLIISCGGGGGDSAPVRVLQPISYTGNTAPVAITLVNTPTLVSNVFFTGTTSSDIPSGVSISETYQSAGKFSAFDDHLMAFYHFTLDNIIGNATDSYSIPTAEIINNTVNCDSGYYTEQGAIDDLTGAGTVTYDYYNCLLDGVIADGRMLLHSNFITITEITITEYELHFNMTNEYVLMTYTGSDLNVSVSGTLAVDGLLSVSTYREQYREQRTRNYVKQNNFNGKMYKYENFVITSVKIKDYYSNSGTISITGTPAAIIYDSLYGSLNVATTEPLSYSSVYLSYPDSGGPMVYTGGNSSIQLGVESSRHAKLELDIDAIAGYEVVRYALWTELEDADKLNLADSDGDGMHDSWEISFGLDPNINDADDNLDNDGLTNLEEYEQGYDPSNPLSQ